MSGTESESDSTWAKEASLAKRRRRTRTRKQKRQGSPLVFSPRELSSFDSDYTTDDHGFYVIVDGADQKEEARWKQEEDARLKVESEERRAKVAQDQENQRLEDLSCRGRDTHNVILHSGPDGFDIYKAPEANAAAAHIMLQNCLDHFAATLELQNVHRPLFAPVGGGGSRPTEAADTGGVILIFQQRHQPPKESALKRTLLAGVSAT